MSYKDVLKNNICKTNKLKLKKNLQPRISEIAHKRNKTYLKGKPYDVEDKLITVNPIYKNTMKKLVCINSKFRHDYCNTSASDFTLTLNYPLKNVISMRLESFEIPNTWYLVSMNQGNNIFYVDYNGTEYPIVIPDGNYISSDIATIIDDVLATVFGANIIKCELITYSNRVIFYLGSLGVGTFKLIFNKSECDTCQYNNTLGWLLGYRQSFYKNPGSIISEATASYETGFESEGIFHDGKDRYFYIVVNDFNNNGNDFIISNLSKSILQKNILARIPITDDKFYVLFNSVEEEDVQQRDYFGPVDITKLQIQILNDFGQVLDLNAMDISLYLELKMLY